MNEQEWLKKYLPTLPRTLNVFNDTGLSHVEDEYIYDIDQWYVKRPALNENLLCLYYLIHSRCVEVSVKSKEVHGLFNPLHKQPLDMVLKAAASDDKVFVYYGGFNDIVDAMRENAPVFTFPQEFNWISAIAADAAAPVQSVSSSPIKYWESLYAGLVLLGRLIPLGSKENQIHLLIWNEYREDITDILKVYQQVSISTDMYPYHKDKFEILHSFSRSFNELLLALEWLDQHRSETHIGSLKSRVKELNNSVAEKQKELEIAQAVGGYKSVNEYKDRLTW